MSKSKPEDGPKGEKVTTLPVRVRTAEAQMIKDLSVAKGRPVWMVVRDLLEPVLSAEWKAAQPKLKKLKELAARADQIRGED